MEESEIDGPGESDADETELMNIWLRNGLRRQGLSEFFFESDEPGFDELTPAAFFRRFPQGVYDIEGITLENEEIESEVFLSHVLAGPPPGNIKINGQKQRSKLRRRHLAGRDRTGDARLESGNAVASDDWKAGRCSHRAPL